MVRQPLAALENSKSIGGENRVPHDMGREQEEEAAWSHTTDQSVETVFIFGEWAAPHLRYNQLAKLKMLTQSDQEAANHRRDGDFV